jgi:hypothetical protein
MTLRFGLAAGMATLFAFSMTAHDVQAQAAVDVPVVDHHHQHLFSPEIAGLARTTPPMAEFPVVTAAGTIHVQ